jgi:hypothetical protein
MSPTDPDPAPSVAEHPTFTAVFDKLLAEVPPIAAPPLELARRKLERLTRELAELTEVEAQRNSLLYPDNSEVWYQTHRELEETSAEVRRLESEAIK